MNKDAEEKLRQLYIGIGRGETLIPEAIAAAMQFAYQDASNQCRHLIQIGASETIEVASANMAKAECAEAIEARAR